jgi:hypothetical protein
VASPVIEDEVTVILHIRHDRPSPGRVRRPDRPKWHCVPVDNEVSVVLKRGEIATFVGVHNLAGNKSLSGLKYARSYAISICQRSH